MALTITRDVIKRVDFDGESGNLDVTFRFEGLAPGNEILDAIEIPPLDHVYKVKGVELYATRYGIEYDYDAPTSAGRVIVTYTRDPAGTAGGDNYVIWEKGYKKDSMEIPAYVLEPEWYVRAGQTSKSKVYKWVKVGYSIPIEMSVLTVTVNRTATGLDLRSQILVDMAVIESQHDHLHIFPQFPGRKWIMQPHNARQASPFRVQLTYSWISDPGNGAPGKPVDDDVAAAYLLPTIDRPPLHYYTPRPQQDEITSVSQAKDADVAPKFSTAPLYPETATNPRYDPNGWRNLPGKPMG